MPDPVTRNRNFRIRRRQVAGYFNDGKTSQAVWSESLENGLKDKKLIAAVNAARDAFNAIWLSERSAFAVGELADPRECENLKTLRPLSEYHEDHGTVLWWHLPIQEPPYVGSGPGIQECQLITNGWLTHWSPIPQPTIKKLEHGTRSATSTAPTEERDE